MCKPSYIFIISILLTISIYSSGQKREMKFETIPPEHGLSNYSVHAIIQDNYGFIWVGTQDGLNKYDGYKFKVYQLDPTDSTTISHNNIYGIVLDKKGYLWIATQKGLNKFDPFTEIFTRFYHDPNEPKSICHNDIRCLLDDGKGNIWIGTWGGGVSKLNKETGLCKHYKHEKNNKNSLAGNKLWGCFQDSKGFLWFSTWGQGLDKLNPDTEIFTHYKHNPNDTNSISHSIIGLVHEDRNGYLWITTWGGGLNRFDPKTETFKSYMHQPDNPYSISSNLNWPIVENANGELIIGTYGSGIDIFDKQSEKFYHYTPNSQDPFSIDGKDNWSLLIDSSNILWIGSDGKGLSKYTGITKKFDFYTEDTTKNISLSYNAIKTIHCDTEGIMWIGTWHAGIDRFDPKTKTITNYRRDIEKIGETGANRIDAVYEDCHNNFWIGTLRWGLTKFDKHTGKFVKDFLYDAKDETSISNNHVQTIANDKNNTLWIGTRDGLNIFNYSTEQFTRIFTKPNDSTSISDDCINTIFCCRNGDLWFGTDNGLNKYNYKNQTFRRFMHNPDDTCSISHSTVYSIYEDKNGVLWIGTKGGLNKFNKNSKAFTSFTVNEGLVSNNIFAILEDGNNDLWLSTNSGISKFIREKKLFINYNEKDGLKGRLFMQGASAKSGDGKLYFGGWEGLTTFYPEEIEINRYKPPVLIITELKKKGKKLRFTRAISQQKVLTFPWNENSFSFDYIALNYINSNKNQYAYKLENFDKNWHYVGNRRFANFTNLNPGEYIFRVRAANNDGIWNEKEAELKIIITPPFWQTTWFIIVCIITGLGLIFLIVKLRERNLQIEKRRLERIVKQRTYEIRQQKEKIEIQKNQMEELHNELKASINYAQNIQNAILPAENNLNNMLKKYFILFKPQSIVSGDYFWAKKIDEWIVFTVADCTGHGVPGAFMSMLGISFLNEIVQKEKITQANEVLNELRELVVSSLKQKAYAQKSYSVKDGMDIALCAWNKKTMKLQFAGANNPLYIIRKKELPAIECKRRIEYKDLILYEIKGDKMPVAIHDRMDSFSNHYIKIEKGDKVYLFSDGFADQFGGPKNKKFMYKRFKMLLLENAHHFFENQKIILDKTFEAWRGTNRQIDDVCVLGAQLL